MSFLSRPISFYEQYMQFLASHHRDQDALEVAELSRANTLAEGLGFSAFYITFPIKGFAPRATAERLNSTILSYWIGIDMSYLWVITPARLELFRLPPAAEIDPLCSLTGRRCWVRGMSWRRGMPRGRNFMICWWRRCEIDSEGFARHDFAGWQFV